MSVTGPQELRVIVDGILWSPVSSDGNTDYYSLTTGGRILIFSSDKLVFSFENQYDADFSFGRNTAIFELADGSTTTAVVANSTYTQTAYPVDATGLRSTFYPNSMADVQDLEPSTNQEGATITKTVLSEYVRLNVSGFDKTRPLEVYLGNVLLTYVVAS